MYFIYPETRGVRLEDMNRIFGDATTMPTPATRAETEPLAPEISPVPPMDLGPAPDPVEDGLRSSRAIPGLNVDPPSVEIRNGRPQYSHATGEGVGGWISRILTRGAGGNRGENNGNRSRYRPLDQQDNELARDRR